MIHAVIITHGRFGVEMVKIAETIAGPVSGIDVVPLDLEDNPASFEAKVREILKDKEDNLLFVADIFGGTPCNTAISLLRHYDAQIVTGLSLGMLLELMMTITGRETAKQMANHLLEVSRQSSQILNREHFSGDFQAAFGDDEL